MIQSLVYGIGWLMDSSMHCFIFNVIRDNQRQLTKQPTYFVSVFIYFCFLYLYPFPVYSFGLSPISTTTSFNVSLLLFLMLLINFFFWVGFWFDLVWFKLSLSKQNQQQRHELTGARGVIARSGLFKCVY